MGLSLQVAWHRHPAATAVPASGSGSSFTNFPVNQQTKHPRTAPRSPAKSSIRSCRFGTGNANSVSPSPATGNTGAQNSLRGHPSPRKMKNSRYMPVASTDGADAVFEKKAVPTKPAEFEFVARGSGLKRKLSKVKSLTEIPLPPYDRRGHTSRVCEGNADNCGNASGGTSAGGAVATFTDVSHQQGKRESRLSSFIRRKFSLDSLASPVIPEEKRPLIFRASSPVISAPLLPDSRWSFRDSAFIVNSADRSRIDGRSVGKGASPHALHASCQTPRSPPARTGYIGERSSKLPEIREEKENAHAYDRRMSGHRAQNIGSVSNEESCGEPRPREPIFKA